MAPAEQFPAVGALQLELDALSFSPGDELSGKVRLTLQQAVQDALITVQINGVQWLHWMHMAVEYTTSHAHVHKHLQSEFHLRDRNGALPPGTDELPFSFDLPVDLIANATLESLGSKRIDDYNHIHLDAVYDVVAKLEVARRSNKSLLHKQVFTIAPVPMATPLGSIIKAESTEQIKLLGFAKGGPCTVRMELWKGVVDLPSGTIMVDVQIELPPKRKPHQIKVVLYEDLFVDRGGHGIRDVSRKVCSQRFKTSHLQMVEGLLTTMVRGTLKLTVSDPDQDWYGAVTASVASRFLQIRHRVGVECGFLMGRAATVSTAVTLVDRSPTATALPTRGATALEYTLECSRIPSSKTVAMASN